VKETWDFKDLFVLIINQYIMKINGFVMLENLNTFSMCREVKDVLALLYVILYILFIKT